jgi:hypothetical protein
VTMLTGMSPFSLFDTSTGAWEWRDYLTGTVGDRLGKILDRMLLGPTKQRYTSAEEVLSDLVGERSVVQEKKPTDLNVDDPLLAIIARRPNLSIIPIIEQPMPLSETEEVKKNYIENAIRLAQYGALLVGTLAMVPIILVLMTNDLTFKSSTPDIPGPFPKSLPVPSATPSPIK